MNKQSKEIILIINFNFWIGVSLLLLVLKAYTLILCSLSMILLWIIMLYEAKEPINIYGDKE